ncbi:MAG: hypothetical protein IPF92_09000 [Myxococcales bacterium]|jgi:hypothetical protein|nr:hypothetical protein [Myxococcales bacterium]MBL0193125.1 hypothetical protein [Myxococcales bacterium]HQY64846.1 hypothetical protein [Polyangiaceae bacterium]
MAGSRVFAAYDALVALAGAPAHAARVERLRTAFGERAGTFSLADERRTRAFWDTALTRGGLARELGPTLAADLRPAARSLTTAHRGLFQLFPDSGARHVAFEDLWSGARFRVEAFDDASAAGIFRHEGGLCDARLVASEAGEVALLPGAFFHPEDATPFALEVLVEGRARGLALEEVGDALLLMEHRLATLSRVKAGFAYRLPAAR